jgi:hypothetical protein
MRNFSQIALVCTLTISFSRILPASPQAKSSRPATHFTQGTITSVDANQLVITRKVRGKSEQITFAIDSQTQRSGNLVAGVRVSVQYREDHRLNVAAAVRELPAEALKSEKSPQQLRSKS